ncbi:hypothetical protein [Pedobacter miscanthi]|uniref:hypothetical protein n=1 Tax=Pedobacter miscanthi TaxID=2259170 RepID=UPI0029314E1A|nr:hypothetical protein [Pedobacter miscanthi]
MFATLSSLFDSKDFVTGVIVFIVTSILLFLANWLIKLRPKVHIQVISETHQINPSNRFFTFGWDTPDVGNEEFLISYKLTVKLENISNSDAFYPQLHLSPHSIQIDLGRLQCIRLKSGESVILQGHYYHTVVAEKKPAFFESPQFTDLEFAINYKNSFGMKFHSSLKNTKISYSFISGFKTF